jgi:hypothetical protein
MNISIRRTFLISGATLLLSCCFGSGVLVGVFSNEGQRKRDQYDRERALITPILAEKPDFANIRIEPMSAGGIYLVGTVPTKLDHEQLQEKIVRAVGESRAREIMVAVSVNQ